MARKLRKRRRVPTQQGISRRDATRVAVWLDQDIDCPLLEKLFVFFRKEMDLEPSEALRYARMFMREHHLGLQTARTDEVLARSPKLQQSALKWIDG